MSSDDCSRTPRSIGGAERPIQLHHICHCHATDPAYEQGVAEALGIPLNEALANA